MTGCPRCGTTIEDGDLRCAICALAVPVTCDPVEKSRAKVLRCNECNAAVAFSPAHQAPRCGFCGATMIVEQPSDPLEVAELAIPFTVDRDGAERSLRRWLGQRGYFAPRTLRAEAVLDSLVPLCWAGWIVSARAGVTWTADSDADSQRSAWAPHAGAVELTFDSICVPASRGLRRDECSQLAPFYDLAKAIPIGNAGGVMPPRVMPSGVMPSWVMPPGVMPSDVMPSDVMPPGVMIEGFEAQRSAARGIVQRAIEQAAKTRVERYIPGRKFRNVHVACLLERQTTDRVALPVWILAYRYRGRPYRAIVHGQRSELVFGRSPLDWGTILRLAGSILAAIAAIALIVMLLARHT